MKLQHMAEGRKDLFMMDPDKLVEAPGWNVRKPGPDLDAHIKWLAESIKEKGVQEPLTIWMNGEIPTVTNGHCRLMAVKLARKEGAEIKSVPVRVEERYASEGDRILSMITRNSGKPLTSIEMGEVFKRLVAYGWSNPDVAKKTGYSAAHVTNLIALANTKPSLQKHVTDGHISASKVVSEVRRKGPEAAEKSIGEAIDKAKASGKEKATGKHFEAPATNWRHWGPVLLTTLQGICNTPIANIGLPIADAQKIIDQIK